MTSKSWNPVQGGWNQLNRERPWWQIGGINEHVLHRETGEMVFSFPSDFEQDRQVAALQHLGVESIDQVGNKRSLWITNDWLVIRRLVRREEVLRQCGRENRLDSDEIRERIIQCRASLERDGTFHEVEGYFAIRSDYEIDPKPSYRVRVRKRDWCSDDYFVESEQGDLAFVYQRDMDLVSHLQD